MKRESKVSESDFTEAVLLLHEKTQRFKDVEARFKWIKSECTETIGRYFNENGIEKSVTVDSDDVMSSVIKVSKVERSSVNFNADRVEKALEKELASKVINKRYEINDIHGMIAYLKTCGVDPKIFKSFLNVIKTVNVKELERLSELGEVDEEDLNGCYTVTRSDPYYKIKAGKGDGDD